MSSKVTLKTSALFSHHIGNFTLINLFDLKKKTQLIITTLLYHLEFSSLNCWLGQSLKMMIAGIKVVEWQ